MAWDASQYVDVATRIAEFRQQYPDGSLQPLNTDRPFWIETLTGSDKDGKPAVEQTFICYAAAAYRTPEDPRPGVGLAYEVFPGRTNFTRGSELQNAETSAWGRAIIAALAADSKAGVASEEEVRNRVAEREPVQRYPRKTSELDAERAQQQGTTPEAERQDRLAEQHVVRDALGVDSKGKRKTGEQIERSNGPADDDPWATAPDPSAGEPMFGGDQ
ncbi:MAG: hypothetical protein ACRDMV_02350 [Streptosporangiales bacterium]